VVSANDTRWLHVAWANAPFDGEFDSSYVRYQGREQRSEQWFGRPSRPGASALADTQVSRTGDEFSMALFPFSDSGGHFGWHTTGDEYTTTLHAGDQLLYQADTPPIGALPAVPTPATYRLTLNAKRSAPWSLYSTETTTTWTFASRRPPDGRTEHPALPQVDYRVPLDELNRAFAGHAYPLVLRVGQVPGAPARDIREVAAWASFNDGATWSRIDLLRLGHGIVLALVRHPRLADTTGAVSLRVRATDTAGNSVDQTLIRSYGLKAVG